MWSVFSAIYVIFTKSMSTSLNNHIYAILFKNHAPKNHIMGDICHIDEIIVIDI